MKVESINRSDFVNRYMRHGFTYSQACKAYECMCEIFEDAVVSGHRLNIGNVMSLAPVWLAPKEVQMGFERTKKGVVKKKKVIWLGKRIRYKVNLYKEFMRRHTLNWF
jgi:hypothetical protein